ncbi:hypothetical protein BCON_0399g00010 [Botryotinia convoluta]|uniref:Carrier domain-containing protein n=1 Tax=Botryotinia convoluta TaxID=54673 RepID=A0A4Z1H8I1_9HELO|nr:hypothetical protein BCON_0399g00010 [Botryotinia convoluta]
METTLYQHAEQSPQAEAVIEDSLTLTYADLLAAAQSLTQVLSIKRAIQPGEPIGIILGPGLKHVVAQVAVIIAGATCVPIEPSLPSKRIRDMLQDVHAERIIVEKELDGLDNFTHTYITNVREMISQNPPRERVPQPESNDFKATESKCSHILFTSGSTGRPKPVRIEERSIVNLATKAPVTPLFKTDRVAEFNNPGFDLSLFEIWVTLLCGAAIVVIPKSIVTDPGSLPTFLMASRITIAIFPTALFNIIVSISPHAFKGLRHMIVAGDAANAKAMRAVLEYSPPSHLWNAYGPTECTTMVTMFEVTIDETRRNQISIGWPIGNTQIFLLDDNLRPVSDGTSGEIFITGLGLSLGYLDRDAETAASFIELPISSLGIEGNEGTALRLYRTGDLGKLRLDSPGCIDYIGRRDTQVKHLGFRVELGEIEQTLQSSEQLTSAVVIYQPPLSISGSSALIAYVIPSNRQTYNHEALLRFSRENLAPHMVPSKIEVVDNFPMTLRGKLDRQALTDRYIQGLDDTSIRQDGNNDTEDIMRQIWKELLKVSKIQENDDFFHLGGSSMQSAALITMIQQRLGRLLTMSDIHVNSRLSEMVNLIQKKVDLHSSAQDDSHIWLKDIDLVEDISLVPDWESETEGHIFLTGVTGFVGAHFLHHIIRRSGVKQVVCLARRKGSKSAASRVQETLKKYDLWPHSFELVQKIVVLEGDMTDDTLALGKDKFAWLTNWASVVFHLAAKVNYCQTYQEHLQDNVLGTRNVLNVAATGRRKAFHYMSSLDVWGPTGFVLGTGHILEDEPLTSHLQAIRYDLGYGQSQWTAEGMVRRMQERGLPVAIYRPGFIIGDSKTGTSNPDDFLSRFIVGCIQLGTFPRIVDMRFEYATVDFVVAATLHIASNNKNLGHAYHLLPPNQSGSPSVEDTCTLINELGYPVKIIDYQLWLDHARKTQLPHGPLVPVIPYLQESVLGKFTRWEVSQYSPRYDCTNSVQALSDCPDIQHIPFTSEILKLSIEFWNRKGFYHI